ncbi:hypothetical protein F8B91_01405 [Aestuariivirga litoralis]|nr:hypothetical protein [Aestuariivirga litoralis]
MSDFTIIVPVFGETRALQFSAFYFGQLGVKPFYVLDSKKQGRRAEVERLLGCEVAIYENPGNYIEANFERLTDLSPTDWILRVDCDEVPNLAMLQHCAKFVSHPSSNICGFDRDDLVWREDHFERIKQPFWFIDTQFRLFNRKQVKFVKRIHTPGFHVSKWKFPLVPAWHGPLNARLYHLQRPFISQADKLEKMQRYDQAGQDPKFHAAMMKKDDEMRWTRFADAAFTSLFASWSKANPVT